MVVVQKGKLFLENPRFGKFIFWKTRYLEVRYRRIYWFFRSLEVISSREASEEVLGSYLNHSAL